MSNSRPIPTSTPASTAMFSSDAYANHVGARLLEFFAETTTWSRRLWNAGSVLTLRELYDAGEWGDRGVLSPGALSWLARDAERLLGQDPAIGGSALRSHLQQTLRTPLTPGTRHHRTLDEIGDLVEAGYIDRWLSVLDSQRAPAPERLARAIASNLLDRGYAMRFLHRWAKKLLGRAAPLGEALTEAAELSRAAPRRFEVLVPFLSVPRSNEQAAHLSGWRSPPEAAEWLVRHGGSPSGIRQNGGFVFVVDALDPYAAGASASLAVERMVARNSYARSGSTRLAPLGQVWVGDSGVSLKLQPGHRGAYVRALESERRLYDVARSTAVDEALELAAPLNFGAPAPAVSGGWAAIEALLVSPRDSSDTKEGRGAVAADRLATLVAASWPRSELTTLSYRHRPDAADRLARELSRISVNRERARHVADSLVRGESLALDDTRDIAAASRMAGVLREPTESLKVVRGHVTSAIRRLYRQRNIIVHGGATDSLTRDVTLRTAAPLIGAGLDRIVHANLADDEEPLEIAERARLGLAIVGKDGGPHVVDLLSPVSVRTRSGRQ